MRPSGTRPALLTLLITLTAARAAPVVSLQTAPSPALPGSSFNLTISVEEVVDLYAFQFELSYAPTLLAASAINEGPFLAQGGHHAVRAGPDRQRPGSDWLDSGHLGRAGVRGQRKRGAGHGLV